MAWIQPTHSTLNGGRFMSECCETHLKLGHPVPDFEIDTYDSTVKNFDKISLEGQKKAGKWTILFFYPADFTFV
jgi:peroxiredoxin